MFDGQLNPLRCLGCRSIGHRGGWRTAFVNDDTLLHDIYRKRPVGFLWHGAFTFSQGPALSRVAFTIPVKSVRFRNEGQGGPLRPLDWRVAQCYPPTPQRAPAPSLTAQQPIPGLQGPTNPKEIMSYMQFMAASLNQATRNANKSKLLNATAKTK